MVGPTGVAKKEKMNFTLETGLFVIRKEDTEADKQNTKELIKYFNANIEKQSRLFRSTWKLEESGAWKGRKSKLNTYIQAEYKVDKRTANTLIQGAIGRKNALLELKKVELFDLKTRQESCEKEIEKTKNKINTMKPKVTLNKATEKELLGNQKTI